METTGHERLVSSWIWKSGQSHRVISGRTQQEREKWPEATHRPARHHAFHPVNLKLTLDHLHHLHRGQHSGQVIHTWSAKLWRSELSGCVSDYECVWIWLWASVSVCVRYIFECVCMWGVCVYVCNVLYKPMCMLCVCCTINVCVCVFLPHMSGCGKCMLYHVFVFVCVCVCVGVCVCVCVRACVCNVCCTSVCVCTCKPMFTSRVNEQIKREKQSKREGEREQQSMEISLKSVQRCADLWDDSTVNTHTHTHAHKTHMKIEYNNPGTDKMPVKVALVYSNEVMQISQSWYWKLSEFLVAGQNTVTAVSCQFLGLNINFVNFMTNWQWCWPSTRCFQNLSTWETYSGLNTDWLPALKTAETTSCNVVLVGKAWIQLKFFWCHLWAALSTAKRIPTEI